MKKRIFSLVLAVLMLFTFNICASAETTVQPRYSYAYTVDAELEATSEQAKCKANIVGYNGTTTRIVTEMTLQKKNIFGIWSDVTSWSFDISDYKVSYSRNYGPLDSGTYRVHVEVTVYSGSASEDIDANSSQVKVS